jgi:hypothetical protein
VEGEKGKGWEIRKGNKKVNMTKVHYMHGCKCHDETPYSVQLIYSNKEKQK